MAEAESDSREIEGQPAADGGTADDAAAAPQEGAKAVPATGTPELVEEIGGPKGAEPTRYGDWERKGRCIDF